MDKLTILQIGTVGTPVKKGAGIGGAEKVLSYLDREYVRQGHNSIVAAPGDSEVYGTLLPTLDHSFNGADDSAAYEEHYENIFQFIMSNSVDIIHDHPGRGFVNSKVYLRNSSRIKPPILITNHGSQLPGLKKDHEQLEESMKYHPIYINAISQAQKNILESENDVKIIDVINHGIPLDILEYNPNPGEYLFYLGRICKQKSQHIAIEVAKKTGNRLILGGSIEDKVYFENSIQPNLNDQIKYVGSLNDQEKAKFYKNALAFIMPITGFETFSLVVAESMASGTPVIVFNYGAVGEVVKNGKTGYVIDPVLKNGQLDLETMETLMEERVKTISSISRADCRKRVEDNFTLEKQSKSYIDLYNQLISKNL
ncbi:D-inositol-3-phosphate glycosyltransferase [uncultured archaeon]|nr:D-inositol-3-phosphate glycosyltransferase [uncultured archaeon]